MSAAAVGAVGVPVNAGLVDNTNDPVPVEVFVEKGKVVPNIEELFESDNLYIDIMLDDETTTTTTQEGPKVLRYTKNNDQ